MFILRSVLFWQLASRCLEAALQEAETKTSEACFNQAGFSASWLNITADYGAISQRSLKNKFKTVLLNKKLKPYWKIIIIRIQFSIWKVQLQVDYMLEVPMMNWFLRIFTNMPSFIVHDYKCDKQMKTMGRAWIGEDRGMKIYFSSSLMKIENFFLHWNPRVKIVGVYYNSCIERYIDEQDFEQNLLK